MRPIRFGMVGGGPSTFIGPVHRSAAWLDGELELVCGAFSSDAKHSREMAAALHLPSPRQYADYETMFACEAQLPADERMEFVTIVTPNYLHLPVAIAALRSGFHVLSDKPATISLDQCFALRDAVKQSNLLYGITHAYACYPLVVEARDLIASGRMGRIRKVIVEYTKGSLAQPLERLGNLRAQRRLDPAWTGPSCCFGDIGVHAFHLAEFVTGLDVVELSADLNHVVEDRAVDDDGTALLRFRNNAHGILIASLICTGEENDLSLRVYGEKAGLAWKQMEPNSLWLKHPDRPAELLRAGSSYLSDTARAHGRLAPGHPEGFIEAFANLYRGFGAKVRAYAAGDTSLHSGPGPEVPGIRTALRGMAFVETAIKASNSTDKWHRFPEIDS